MPKNLLIALLLGLSQLSWSQEVGLRFGEMDGNNIGVDFVIPIKEHRLHSTVTFGDNVGMDILYDFAIRSMFGSSAFVYYVGLGGSFLFAGNTKFGVTGELGFEYRFKTAPIALGLDYRPSIIILDKMDFVYANLGLNVRYVFH